MQLEPVRGDVQGNLSTALSLIDALTEKPDFVVLPEMGLVGYLWDDAEEILPVALECSSDAEQASWVSCAKERNIWLLVGHPALDRPTGELRNRCTLVSPEAVVGHYDKTCLFPADTTWATAGAALPPVWDTPWGKISPLICADLDYPEPIQSALSRGAAMIALPTAWVDEPAPSATWILRGREHHIPIVAADITGVDRATVFSGGTCVLDCEGNPLDVVDTGLGAATATLELTRRESGAYAGGQAISMAREAVQGFRHDEVTVAVLHSSEPISPETLAHAPSLDEPSILVTPLVQLAHESDEELVLEACRKLSGGSHIVLTSTLSPAKPVAEVRCILPGGWDIVVARLERENSADWKSVSGAETAVLLEAGQFRVGVLGAHALERSSVSRALSAEGAHILIATGPHRLCGPIGFEGTEAPFPEGLADADPTFAHPLRFRAGDSNVWLACATSTEIPRSGIFSPNHVRWPRNEVLSSSEGWVSHRCSMGPTNLWGRDATSKPLLRNRRRDLYADDWTIHHRTSERSSL